MPGAGSDALLEARFVFVQGELGTDVQQYLQGLEQQPEFQKGLQQILKGQPVSSLHAPPATSTSAGVPRLPIKGELLRF